ncbi:MAG: FadR family transcriptional regulator [Alphaproteobacteria bacterium]|nr:FadR family transcriptional regulator [Alphaproteobacteria bacterium]
MAPLGVSGYRAVWIGHPVGHEHGMALDLAPPRRTPLAAMVFDQLLAQIEHGKLRPGDRLPPELELTRILEVGRSSVREALHGLIALGLIETKPGRGAVVVGSAPHPFAGLARMRKVATRMQASALSDLLEVRESLEGKAAHLAAQRASDADIALIERAAGAIDRRPAGRAAYFKANVAFHVAIARASHNRALERAITLVIGQVRSFRERLIDEVEAATAGDEREHRAIVSAIRERNPRRAERAAIDHVRTFANLTEQLMARLNPGPADVALSRSTSRRSRP